MSYPTGSYVMKWGRERVRMPGRRATRDEPLKATLEENKVEKDYDNSAGWVLAAAALFLPCMLYEGWAFAWMWAWFIAPLGAPPIGVAHSVGLLLVVSIVGRAADTAGIGKKSDEPLALRLLAGSLLWTWLLGAGWVVASFMPAVG